MMRMTSRSERSYRSHQRSRRIHKRLTGSGVRFEDVVKKLDMVNTIRVPLKRRRRTRHKG